MFTLTTLLLLFGVCACDQSDNSVPQDRESPSESTRLLTQPAKNQHTAALTSPDVEKLVSVASFLNAELDRMKLGKSFPAHFRNAIGSFSLEELETLAAELPLGDTQRGVTVELARRRAMIDPHQCVDWLSTLPVDSSSIGAFAGAASVIARKDPRLAQDFTSTIEDPLLRAHFAASALNSWASMEDATGYAYALEFLKTNSKFVFDIDSEMASFVLARTNFGDFAGSLTFLEKVEADIDLNTALAIETLGVRWVGASPSDAAGWIGEEIGSPYAPDLAEVVARQWAKRDPPTVSEWLQSLSPSVKRDRAIIGFAKETYANQPILSLDWVASITDEGLRRSTAADLRKIITPRMDEVNTYAETLGLGTK